MCKFTVKFYVNFKLSFFDLFSITKIEFNFFWKNLISLISFFVLFVKFCLYFVVFYSFPYSSLSANFFFCYKIFSSFQTLSILFFLFFYGLDKVTRRKKLKQKMINNKKKKNTNLADIHNTIVLIKIENYLYKR